MEKKNLKKKIVVFTPYYHPEPFPINTFINELSKREDIENIKVITSLPNYRNYNFYSGYSFLGPYSETKRNISIARLFVIPRYSNSAISIFLFYLTFFISSFIYLTIFSIYNRNRYNHILSFCGSPVFVGYLGYYSSLLLNASSSQWVQDIWPEAIMTTIGLKGNFFGKIIKYFQDIMWRYSDILFAESESLAKYLKSNFPKKRVKVLYNPVRKINQELNLYPDNVNNKLIFSYTGNIGGAQNLSIILEAFIKLDHNKFELHMCGDGPLLEKFKKQYDVENVFWHGWLNNDKLTSITSKSHYFILSLNSVGRQSLILPSKLQTYFQMKKPVFCISSGAVKELIDKVNSGITCSSDNIKDVKKLFEDCQNHSQSDRIKMSENGYRYYLENFDTKIIVSEFINSI